MQKPSSLLRVAACNRLATVLHVSVNFARVWTEKPDSARRGANQTDVLHVWPCARPQAGSSGQGAARALCATALLRCGRAPSFLLPRPKPQRTASRHTGAGALLASTLPRLPGPPHPARAAQAHMAAPSRVAASRLGDLHVFSMSGFL